MVVNDQERRVFSCNVICRAIGIFFLCLFTGNAVLAQLTEQVPKNWAVNGGVLGTARIGNTLYMVGGFTMIGAPAHGGLIVNQNGTSNDLLINDMVSTGVSDDAGGWFIGGQFSTVLGQTRKGVAHINADGTLSAWTANLEGGSAIKIKKYGSLIYIAGDYTSVNGVSRNGLAAVDAVTGAVSSWNPNPNGAVTNIELDGTNAFISGWFNTVGGQSRNYLAAVNQSTGSVLSWNPNPSMAPQMLALSGSTLYLCGYFNKIMGTTRNNAAAINTSTFTLSAWDPNPSSAVNGIFVDGSTVYLYGGFYYVRGSSGMVQRTFMAGIDATTGFATAFNPSANNPQATIMNAAGMFLIGSVLYVSAEYKEAGNPYASTFLVGLDPVTGAKSMAASLNPGIGATFPVMIPGSMSNYFIGGVLKVKNGTPRYTAAAIDLVANTLLPWDPLVNISPFSIAAGTNTVFLGGFFTKVGSDNRNGLAEVDAISGKATSWNHSTDGNTTSLLVHNSTLYVGGGFTNVDGQPQNNLASFDLSTGNLNNWKPEPDEAVMAMAANGNILYAGGGFRNIGGKPRNFLAAIDATTANATSWNPDMNDAVNSLSLYGSSLYAGGDFTSVNNMVVSRQGAAAYNITDGSLLPWNPKVTGFVKTVCATDKVVYLGGYFDHVGDEPRSNVAAVAATNGAVLSWNPKIDSWVMQISLINNQVFVAGEYYRVNSFVNTGLSVYNMPTLLPLRWGNISASLDKNQVLVSWTTLQETNTHNFIVQHSTNGVNWKNLGIVSAAGNSNTPKQYNYLHTAPAAGGNYYRVVQYDVDGNNTNSKIVSVRTGELQKGFAIMGNPVSDGILKLQLSAATEVAVYSIDGKLFGKKYLSAGSQSIDVSAYPKGIYNVRVGKETGRVIIQ